MDSVLSKLPDVIKVKILVSKQGTFIAELLEYDIFTEADSKIELDYNINDLIYAFFEIPKKYQGKIYYKPVKEVGINKSVLFNVLFSPDVKSQIFKGSKN